MVLAREINRRLLEFAMADAIEEGGAGDAESSKCGDDWINAEAIQFKCGKPSKKQYTRGKQRVAKKGFR